MRYLFLCALAFGLFASMLASGLSQVTGDESAPADRGVALIDTRANDERSSFQGLGSRIELGRSADGHFYADVAVNGQDIRFLVDTGASMIALSRDDARRAGLATSIGMPQIVGQGASGDVHGEVVTLERVSLGSREAEDVPAVVLDTGAQSLLGQSFLSKFDAVEIRGDTMVLQ